jgi:hypothetical protein
MMSAANTIDQRVINVSIEVNGATKIYSYPLMIRATGTKYANALQNEAEIILTNLDRETQDYILTETSPYNLNRTPKTVVLSAGRVSYGTAVIFRGNVVSSRVTQPPDVGIVLKCLTGNFIKGNILARFQPGQATLSQISKQVSQDIGTLLNFQATDRNIANYNFVGAAPKQVDLLGSFGGINAFIDDDTLVVKNADSPLRGKIKIVNASTGMVGIPEFTEWGIKVKFLLDNQTTIGGGLRLTSQQYPAANGLYVIYKLGFDIATRDTPFYYIAECRRISS